MAGSGPDDVCFQLEGDLEQSFAAYLGWARRGSDKKVIAVVRCWGSCLLVIAASVSCTV